MAVDVKSLDRMFNPRVVAVVGDSKKGGFMFLPAMKDFQGKLYSIQVNPEDIEEIEAMGITNYRSILEVPEPVDYVLLSIPRRLAPQIVAECIKKGVGGVALFAAGFAETDTEEGRQSQAELTRMAKEAGLNLIGPNCMGIYNAQLGVRFGRDQYVGTDGRVGFISQSGGNFGSIIASGVAYGVKLAKGISYGNAIVLDSSDYLDYFAQDPAIEVIGMYIEGVKDGRRFFKTLREVAAKKPVIIWRGGQTEDSSRAVFSHTANLAESPLIWEAMMKQVGAVKVDNAEETVDTLKAFLYMKPPRGNRMGLVVGSGGQSVEVADAFGRAGLRVPKLTPESYAQLSTFVNVVGGSFQNPMDINWGTVRLENYERILNILERDNNVDCLAAWMSVGIFTRRGDFSDKLLAILGQFNQRSAKPFMVILNADLSGARVAELRAKLVAQGLAVYSSFATAANSLKRYVDYWQRREARA